MLWSSTELAQATAGTGSTGFAATGVAFDSREVGPGDLFVAMRGETADGHAFVEQAFARGASGAIVEHAIEHPHILVADSAAALNALGVASRARTAARICGVTGSVGKTGTKEALFAALDRFVPGLAHRSVKSYNNHVGVPLSLARMQREARFGVFEMGMNHAGELSALTAMVRPHVAIVTAIASAHREFFASEADIADAKAEIFEGLEPSGTAIVPFDSPHRERLVAAASRHAGRVWTFGRGEGADVRAIDAVPAGGGGSLVTARLPGGELCFTVRQAGAHWVSNALAVIAAVEALGGDLAQAGLALAEMGGLKGRGARVIVHLPPPALRAAPPERGEVGETATLIDESYNANPASMAATLAQLGEERAARKIAVLGGMRELGAESARFHADIAQPLEQAGVDFALLVGDEMLPLAEELEGRVDFAHVADAASALAQLRPMLRAGDAVLVKGSNSIGLGKVVDALAGESDR